MTGNERPDIYADGLREERTECECGRRPEFVHRTQAEAVCNYWEAR